MMFEISPSAERNGSFSLSDTTPELMLKRLRDTEQAIRTKLKSNDSEPSVEENEESHASELELSIVLPCLNQAETLEASIQQIQQTIQGHGIKGEIVVADNGSTDGSIPIANELGVRVVHVREKGYGSVVREGVEFTRGKYVIVGEADGSYDFQELPWFLEKLREGSAYVHGCRFKKGGGKVLPGAMSRWRRWIGSPVFSFLVRRMFRASVRDAGCGFRGFTRSLFNQLDLQSNGRELTAEMIAKVSIVGGDIAEVPVTLHPSSNRAGKRFFPTFRGGWRTARFFLMYSTHWLFFVPAIILCLIGMCGYAVAMPGMTVGGVQLDTHALLVASLAGLLGFQLLQFVAFAKTFAVTEGFISDQQGLGKLFIKLNLERCLLVGLITFLTGIALVLGAWSQWSAIRFETLDHPLAMRWLIPGFTLSLFGFQTILGSFFVSILRLRWRREEKLRK